MTIKDLHKQYADNLTEAILELPMFSRAAISKTIESHLSLFTLDLSGRKIKNLTNTIEQLERNLEETTDPEEQARIRSRITAVNSEMNRSDVIVTESERENNYRRLRQLLKDNGLDNLLKEFDEKTMEMKQNKVIHNHM